MSLWDLTYLKPPLWCIKHPMGAWHIFPPRMMRWLWKDDVRSYHDRS